MAKKFNRFLIGASILTGVIIWEYYNQRIVRPKPIVFNSISTDNSETQPASETLRNLAADKKAGSKEPHVAYPA